MTRNMLRPFSIAGAVLLTVVPLLGHASEDAKAPRVEVTTASVDSRVANARRLLESSSGAQRIASSDNEEAKRQRREAMALFQRAEAASKAGHLEEANRLLDDSTRGMFEAVRTLGPAAETIEKKHTDFENRARTIQALLVALNRIGAESGKGGPPKKLMAQIEAEVGRARKLFEQGQLDEGRKILDAAYEQTKLAVEALREGETVVRSLDFANKEEEYHYEIDRNDTHRMLVKVLLEEKRKTQSIDDLVNKFIESSNSLRRKAEAQAEKKEFEAAIRTLEQSTKELVRAIRGAGVYIPG